MVVKEEIVKKLGRLPESELHEVLMFVDFLVWKTDDTEEDSVLSVAGILSGQPMTALQIEQSLYGDQSTE